MSRGRRPGRGVVGGCAARSRRDLDAAGRPVTRRALPALRPSRVKGRRGNQDVMGPTEEEVAERAAGETPRCQVGKLSRQPSRRELQSAGQSTARVLTVSGPLGPEPIRSGSWWLGCAFRFSCQTGVLSHLLVTQTLVRPDQTESVCGVKSPDPCSWDLLN